MGNDASTTNVPTNFDNLEHKYQKVPVNEPVDISKTDIFREYFSSDKEEDILESLNAYCGVTKLETNPGEPDAYDIPDQLPFFGYIMQLFAFCCGKGYEHAVKWMCEHYAPLDVSYYSNFSIYECVKDGKFVDAKKKIVDYIIFHDSFRPGYRLLKLIFKQYHIHPKSVMAMHMPKWAESCKEDLANAELPNRGKKRLDILDEAYNNYVNASNIPSKPVQIPIPTKRIEDIPDLEDIPEDEPAQPAEGTDREQILPDTNNTMQSIEPVSNDTMRVDETISSAAQDDRRNINNSTQIRQRLPSQIEI